MRRTSLYERLLAAGARLIEFSGWEMPVQYRGILDEHRAVRERAGLFDLSHMGELWVSGPGAAAGLAYALVGDPGRLSGDHRRRDDQPLLLIRRAGSGGGCRPHPAWRG